MKAIKSIHTVVAFFSCVSSISAQTTIESFDAFVPSQSLFSAFGGSPPASQFIQNAGFITIAPVNGGNPVAGATFTKTKSLDLSGSVALSLTGRLEAGDEGSLIEIGLKDSNGTEFFSSIPASLFSTQAFSTVTVAIETNGPFALVLDLLHIEQWSIDTDNASGPKRFRFSFADLSALSTAPSTLQIGFYPNLEITLIGTIGKTYSIQASDTIAGSTNWLTLTNLTLPFYGQNTTLFTDTNAPNLAARFYRAKLAP
jgi:hypothetical protein